MIGLALILSTGVAAGPVGAVIEPSDVVEQFRMHAAESGRTGEAAELLCKPAAEGIQVCATVLVDKGWRYATHADRKVVAPTASIDGQSAGFEVKEIEGMGRYWVRELNDGREGLLYVQPDAFKSLTPVSVVVAWPVPGVVIAWVPGNPALDKVLSIGVTRMVEESNHPISAKLYKLDKGEWSVWGEARPSPSD